MNKAILMLAAVFAFGVVGVHAQGATPANPPGNGAAVSPSPSTSTTKSMKSHKKSHKKHKSSKTEAQ